MAATPASEPDPTPPANNLAALSAQLTDGTLAHDLVSVLVGQDQARWNDLLAEKLRALLEEQAARLRDGSA
jgi:hypothetical protein